VVALVLVRVDLGELGERAVEPVARAEVGGDRLAVAGAGVGAGERPAAHLAVVAQLGRVHLLDRRRCLGVPQLAHVVVAAAVRVVGMQPAEQHVARRLHQPLAVDDPAALVGLLGAGGVGLEHRPLRLLDLEHERVGGVAAEQQHDPRTGTHAADADDLVGEVDGVRSGAGSQLACDERGATARGALPRSALVTTAIVQSPTSALDAPCRRG
jgi:hypothetical protein